MKKLTLLTLTLLLTALAQLTAQLPPEQAQLPQSDRPIVQLVHFRPSDKPVLPNVDAIIDELIKEVQQFYADEMERHGFGKKTFQFEADANGNAVVHHVDGKFPYAHYQQNLFSWKEEINEQVYIPGKSITVTMLDIPVGEKFPGALGHGGGSPYSGGSASIYSWNSSIIGHELGHAFGMLYHDFRANRYLMSYGSLYGFLGELSPCFAAWLDVHPAFNPTVVRRDTRATIQMLPATLAAPPNAIRIRFTITAPAGSLYQARLLSGSLIGCKRIDGNPTRSTVEFVTALAPDTKSVTLHIIGIDGDSVGHEIFPIDVASLLPPARVVSIPDPNLAAVVREELKLSVSEAITTHTMLALHRLSVRHRWIKDLTGLEHATNLKALSLIQTRTPNLTVLDLNNNAISPWSLLAGLTQLETLNLDRTDVSDISPLSALTQLKTLSLSSSYVSDISPLSALTQLKTLNLNGTDVSDISPLSALTQLKTLNLRTSRDISDISPLSALTQLEVLHLSNTDVSDISPLSALTQLEVLHLSNTDVSDISPLTALSQLRELWLFNTDVSDISPLTALTQLKWLYLNIRNASDISPLTALTQLRVLYLNGTRVSDISPLTALTQLAELGLSRTAVSDISPLSGLTHLGRLYLENTDVSDISPLTALSQLKWLHLEGCPLSYASVYTHIPAMQANGIRVFFDNDAYPALLKDAGDRQEGTGGEALPNPFVVSAMDAHGKPIVGETVQFDILAGDGTLSAKIATTDAQGKARVTLTLGSAAGVNKVKATSEWIRSWVLFTAVATEDAPPLVGDVNRDGVVDQADLAIVSQIVAQTMGKPVENPQADVNGDGVVDGEDFALVAANLGEGEAAAPSQAALPAGLTLEEVEWALNLLHAENTGSPAFRRGIAKLEGFLALLVPDETMLLANYPNPFNPETWIPYQLANPAEVTVTIYAANGAVVRTLGFGYRRAGSYASRHRAAYWDGQNAQGEPVASGVYFYTLQAGEFSATRKMVIRK